MNRSAAVSIKGLKKSYGDFDAVKGIDLEIPTGEVFAILGPNGAGKTTTVEILEGYRDRTAGEVQVLGVDPAAPTRTWREQIGIVLQESEPNTLLSVRETLEMFAGYYSSPRGVEETIELVGLSEKADTRAGRLSGGQKRRLDVGLALIGDPDLIFLDEPTTGLDPRSRNQVWNVVRALVADGTTVLLTTQYLDEADQLADRIAVIDHGKVIAEGTSSELKASVGAGALHVRVAEPEQAEQAEQMLVAALGDEVSRESDGISLSARADDPSLVASLLTQLNDSGVEVTEFSLGQPSLDEVFLALTGHPAEDDAERSDQPEPEVAR